MQDSQWIRCPGCGKKTSVRFLRSFIFGFKWLFSYTQSQYRR